MVGETKDFKGVFAEAKCCAHQRNSGEKERIRGELSIKRSLFSYCVLSVYAAANRHDSPVFQTRCTLQYACTAMYVHVKTTLKDVHIG